MRFLRKLLARESALEIEPKIAAPAPRSVTPGWHGPTPERLELARRVAKLRREGLIYREIAERLGISRSYAHGLVSDPTGELARARKDSYAQPCIDCGAVVSGGEGRQQEPRCFRCASVIMGSKRKVWTPERILAAIRWWNDVYGEPPALFDWNAWGAANELCDLGRSLRAERHHKDGQIPSTTTVVRVFGSWNDAIAAAGFTPRRANGGGGNSARRRSMQPGVSA